MGFSHAVTGRNPRSIIILVMLYLTVLGALVLLDAAVWLMGGVVVISLPALYDVVVNRKAELAISEDQLTWISGQKKGAIDLKQIARARFDTRLDLSVRVTIILVEGGKIRLPYDCLPAHRAFEAALIEAGIITERHHFQLL